MACILLGRKYTFIESHQVVPGNPLGLNLSDLGSTGSRLLKLKQNLAQRLSVFCDTQDELVIPRINCAADEFTGLGIGTGDDQILSAHDVPLEASGNEAVDVLANGNKNFP